MKKNYEKLIVIFSLGILSSLWIIVLKLEILPKDYERILILIFTLILILLCYKISIRHKVVNPICRKQLEFKSALYSIAIAVVLRCFVRVFVPILGPFANDDLVDLLYAKLGEPLLLLFFIIFMPILEELCFRGIIMNYCYSMSRKGLIITCLLFGAAHATSESNPDSFIKALLFYSAMGLGMSLPYYREKKIEYSMLTHILNNALATLML